MPIFNQVVPDVGVKPLASRVTEAVALQTALVNSKLALFKAGVVTLSPVTTKALLDANECDFDGYTTGGQTIAAWGDPLVDPGEDTVLLPAEAASHKQALCQALGFVFLFRHIEILV